MNYADHYNRLIDRARDRVIDVYTERHHVLPRCMGGTNKRDNIVRLTAEEHYVAHQLLVKMYPHVPGLVGAALMLSGKGSPFTHRNNKTYGWLRRRYAEAKKGWMHSPEIREQINAKNRGKVRSEEFKRGVAEFHRGRKRPDTGKRIAEAHRNRLACPKVRAEFSEKMRAVRLGRGHSEETRAKLSRSLSGRTISAEARLNMSLCKRGKRKSEETRRRMSEARKLVAARKRAELQDALTRPAEALVQ